MNAQEALTLCRLVKAACPQQALDDLTPDAWALILGPYRFEDCKQAVVELVRSQPFVAPAEIITRVKAIRGDRLAKYGPIDPPEHLADDPNAWLDWFNETRRAIADGDLLPPERRPVDTGEAEKVRRAIAGTFRRPGDEPSADPGVMPPCEKCDDPWCDGCKKPA